MPSSWDRGQKAGSLLISASAGSPTFLERSAPNLVGAAGDGEHGICMKHGLRQYVARLQCCDLAESRMRALASVLLSSNVRRTYTVVSRQSAYFHPADSSCPYGGGAPAAARFPTGVDPARQLSPRPKRQPCLAAPFTARAVPTRAVPRLLQAYTALQVTSICCAQEARRATR